VIVTIERFLSRIVGNKRELQLICGFSKRGCPALNRAPTILAT
jgi:hypothetical protein